MVAILKFNKLKGFTLIEILIVLVIIGIIMSFAVVSYGDFGETRQLKMAQQHFVDQIKLVQTKAIISTKTYGLNISTKDHTFFQFSPRTKKWLTINEPIFKKTAFPPHKKLNYTHPSSKQTPEIIISPDGQITPFTFELTSQSNESAIIEVKANGEIALIEKGPTS